MFEVLPSCPSVSSVFTQVRSRPCTPLVDCLIDSVLLQTRVTRLCSNQWRIQINNAEYGSAVDTLLQCLQGSFYAPVWHPTLRSCVSCTGWRLQSGCIQISYALLVYKCLHGSAPAYITEEVCQVADVEARQRLRLSSSWPLIVSRTRISTVGDRTFLVAAARVWNSLPDHVTSAPSVAVFRSRLKTHLF